MRKTTLGVVLALTLTAACEPYAGDSMPGSMGVHSANSASSAGNAGLLYAVLGIALLALLVGDSNNNSMYST